MADEETLINKIITVDTILEIANYLNDKLEEYKRLYEEEIKKNQSIDNKNQVFRYKLYSTSKIEYEITFTDNRTLRHANYDWFINALSKPSLIKKAYIYYCISYLDNSEDIKSRISRSAFVHITFYEDSIKLRVSGDNLEDEKNNLYITLINMLENSENRYNKTVKNKSFRIQSFCLSLGFVLSYIIYLIIIINRANLPEMFIQFLNNKYFLIIGQWIVSAIIGNVIGYPIMMNFYKNIIPKRIYSYYSKSSHKGVYVDNLEDFVQHNEVQIGKFADNGKNRNLIEKIYKITNKIVLVQVLLSIIYFLILK